MLSEIFSYLESASLKGLIKYAMEPITMLNIIGKSIKAAFPMGIVMVPISTQISAIARTKIKSG